VSKMHRQQLLLLLMHLPLRLRSPLRLRLDNY
jgi:hypothetical protein